MRDWSINTLAGPLVPSTRSACADTKILCRYAEERCCIVVSDLERKTDLE